MSLKVYISSLENLFDFLCTFPILKDTHKSLLKLKFWWKMIVMFLLKVFFLFAFYISFLTIIPTKISVACKFLLQVLRQFLFTALSSYLNFGVCNILGIWQNLSKLLGSFFSFLFYNKSFLMYKFLFSGTFGNVIVGKAPWEMIWSAIKARIRWLRKIEHCRQTRWVFESDRKSFFCGICAGTTQRTIELLNFQWISAWIMRAHSFYQIFAIVLNYSALISCFGSLIWIYMTKTYFT